MLIDLEQHELCAEPFRSQVCIIGSGVAGLILARALASRNIAVALAEAGGRDLEDRSQSIYNAQMSARTHTGTYEGRFRLHGGSSTRWGAQMLPYTPDIFQPAPTLPSSAWPISGEELPQYFPELQRIMGADDLPFEGTAFLASQKQSTPAFLDALDGIRFRFSKWAPFQRRNLAATIAKELEEKYSDRVTQYLHANLTELLLAANGTNIEAALVRNYSGTHFRFVADRFVLAAGTIETPRLLLASRSVAGAGVGNDHDQVGRYFHDHLSVPAATLEDAARSEMLKPFAPWLIRGTTHTAKLEANPALREQLGLLACMAHITIEEPEDSGPGVAKALLQSVQRGDLKSALGSHALKLPAAAIDIARLGIDAKFKHRRFVSAGAAVTLRIDTEQLPRPDVRIRLGNELDALGMPRAIVDWTYGDEEVATMRAFAMWLRNRLTAAHFPPIAWRKEFFDPATELTEIRDTYHPMGGARMGADPRSSVVNPDLDVHGIANLAIASAAVFPAGGSSNPTFTLMALTLRLADRLAAQLA